MIRLALFSAATMLVLSACSTDPVTPPTDTSTYVVATAGSYFVHNNIVINIDTAGIKTDAPATLDSTAVNGTKAIDGKTAVESIVFVGAVPADSTYLAQEGAKISTLTQLQFIVVGIPVNLGNKWVLSYDANATSWTALNDTIPTFTVDAGPGRKYDVSAKLLFNGTKLSAENITVDDTVVSAVKTELKMLVTLYVKYGVVFPIPIELVRTTWFAKGIGVVKIEQDAKLIDTPFGKLAIPGQRVSTVRFKVVS